MAKPKVNKKRRYDDDYEAEQFARRRMGTGAPAYRKHSSAPREPVGAPQPAYATTGPTLPLDCIENCLLARELGDSLVRTGPAMKGGTLYLFVRPAATETGKEYVLGRTDIISPVYEVLGRWDFLREALIRYGLASSEGLTPT